MHTSAASSTSSIAPAAACMRRFTIAIEATATTTTLATTETTTALEVDTVDKATAARALAFLFFDLLDMPISLLIAMPLLASLLLDIPLLLPPRGGVGGNVVGDSVGWDVVGDDVVGDAVGWDVVGDAVGWDVVGDAVGWDVVGDDVGDAVGWDVVGDSVGQSCGAPQFTTAVPWLAACTKAEVHVSAGLNVYASRVT